MSMGFRGKANFNQGRKFSRVYNSQTSLTLSKQRERERERDRDEVEC